MTKDRIVEKALMMGMAISHAEILLNLTAVEEMTPHVSLSQTRDFTRSDTGVFYHATELLSQRAISLACGFVAAASSLR
jgi:hypothetical protein